MLAEMPHRSETIIILCRGEQIQASLIGVSIRVLRELVAKIMSRRRPTFVIPADYVPTITTKSFSDPAFADLPGEATHLELKSPRTDGSMTSTPVMVKRVPEDYVLRPGDYSVEFADANDKPVPFG